jgi:hypothetical protein
MIAMSIKHQLTDSLQGNFDSNTRYFEYEFKIFFELEPSIFEIGKCAIMRLNYATITLTNHLLERLLKLALIHKTVGINRKFINQWNINFTEPMQKYGSLTLGKSIDQCKKENLIDDDEKDFLFNIARETFRNGFSHGDAAKILSEMPDEAKYYHTEPDDTAWSEMNFNPKAIPQLQTVHMEAFANENAKFYFDYVFQLMISIEYRIAEFEK